MKYFITGATGFIGGHVATQLVEAGHQVVALVRTPEKAKDLAEKGIQLARGDITDKESMRAPMTGVDGVFHIAGWYEVGPRDKSLGQKINIEGTRNTLEMMRELKIPRGVYTSTLAVYSDTHGKLVDEQYRYNGPHLTEYDRTKWVAHYEIAEPMQKQGLPLIILVWSMARVIIAMCGPRWTNISRANCQSCPGKRPFAGRMWPIRHVGISSLWKKATLVRITISADQSSHLWMPCVWPKN